METVAVATGASTEVTAQPLRRTWGDERQGGGTCLPGQGRVKKSPSEQILEDDLTSPFFSPTAVASPNKDSVTKVSQSGT